MKSIEILGRSPTTFMVWKHRKAMNLDPLASYVKQREGQRVIRKILISNNGMAAVKAPEIQFVILSGDLMVF